MVSWRVSRGLIGLCAYLRVNSRVGVVTNYERVPSFVGRCDVDTLRTAVRECVQ